MEINPITSDAEFDATAERVAALFDRNPAPETREYHDMEVLLALMRDWEARHHPTQWGDPIFNIKVAMEERGLTRADLEPAIGSRARVSKIMTKKRRLTLDMINRLAPMLGLPVEALTPAYRLASQGTGPDAEGNQDDEQATTAVPTPSGLMHSRGLRDHGQG